MPLYSIPAVMRRTGWSSDLSRCDVLPPRSIGAFHRLAISPQAGMVYISAKIKAANRQTDSTVSISYSSHRARSQPEVSRTYSSDVAKFLACTEEKEDEKKHKKKRRQEEVDECSICNRNVSFRIQETICIHLKLMYSDGRSLCFINNDK